jgi:hypothetical protein
MPPEPALPPLPEAPPLPALPPEPVIPASPPEPPSPSVVDSPHPLAMTANAIKTAACFFIMAITYHAARPSHSEEFARRISAGCANESDHRTNRFE